MENKRNRRSNILKSKDWFKINGISSDTVGIYVDTPSVPLMARQRYTTYQTSTDEDRTSPDDTYENLKYSLIFYTFDRESFDNSDIYAFIAKAETLQISRLSDYYFKIRERYIDSAENISKGLKIRYNATFILAPFKYVINNPEISVTSGDIVTNNGTRYSKPVFRIAGTGDIKINVNGSVFEVKELSENQEIVIDSSSYITYSGNNLFYNKTVGKYPLLAVGDNLISYEGNISSVKIIKNERCY